MVVAMRCWSTPFSPQTTRRTCLIGLSRAAKTWWRFISLTPTATITSALSCCWITSRTQAIATAKVVKAMHNQIAPQFVKSFWEVRFPGQIPKDLVAAEVLQGSEFELEGKKLVVEEVGHTDTADTTSLYIPSIDLVVAGDAVYNGVHPYLVESNKQTRLEWIAALDKIEALNPRAVIAGHKVPENDDDPKNIEETRRYIRDFIRLNDSTQTARELYDRMLELYPDRV